MIGIYKIINMVNGKVYVGKTAMNFNSRWAGHKYNLRNNIHPNSHLQSSWNKYGGEKFEFEIIEECSEEKLKEREEYWIKFHDSCSQEKGYNLTLISEGKNHLSEETKRKIGEAQMGEKNHMFGVHKNVSEETKQKLRKANLGKIISAEIREKISNTLKNGKSSFFYNKFSFKGEENGFSKLTWEKVKEIREKYKSGEYSAKKIAKEYSVSKRTILCVVRNETWIENKEGDYIPSSFVNNGGRFRKGSSPWNKNQLTLEQIIEIKEKYIPRRYTQKMLAIEYNVTSRIIFGILNSKSWIEEECENGT